MNVLETLNPEQREAVLQIKGPLLILAGAGSGKTRVITSRIAYLVGDGHAKPHEVLAVTFTNKAAEEMRNRVSALLLRAGIPPAQPWLSTFHSLCARLLRREAAAAGLARDFAIYDDDDQLAAVKLAMTKLQIEDDSLTPRNILSRISHAKNHAQTAEHLRAEAFDQNASGGEVHQYDFDIIIAAGCLSRISETHLRLGDASRFGAAHLQRS